MWASPPTVGQKAAPEGLEPVIRSMVEALEQAAGLRPGRDRLDAFLTQGTRWEPRAVPVVSFSGGVADCRFDSVRLYADRMTAVVQAQTVVWDKRISGNPEQGFSVELPVNRDAITATMKKENGVWKLDSIDSQISLSAAVPADDEVCRERYLTFETARQAADSIDDQAYIKEARFA